MQRYSLTNDVMLPDDHGEWVQALDVPPRAFNMLTPGQDEALTILTEECAELIKAITKIQRHGLHSYHPRTGITNLASLAHEMGDVLAAFVLMYGEALVDPSAVEHMRNRKLRVLPQHLHHIKLPES